jgi:hypothetical protein
MISNIHRVYAYRVIFLHQNLYLHTVSRCDIAWIHVTCRKHFPVLSSFITYLRVCNYQNPYIEEEQTTQWPKEKVQKDKQRSTKHPYKTKDRVTWTPLKTGGELRCSGKVSSSCATSDTRRVNLVTNPVISDERVYGCFVDRCLSFCTFSFGHCVVCSSSIYGFWLPLWYLQTLLTNHLCHGFSEKLGITWY